MKNLKISALFFVLVFALVLVFVFSGCESFNSIVDEPDVSLASVDLAGISFNGVNLVAHVDVENPNAFSIPLPDIDWELFIGASSFVKGTLPGDKTIGARNKVTVDIPVSVTYEGLYGSFESLVETKEAAYKIALGVSFPIPIIESKVYPLEFSGVIPLPQLPKLSPGSVKISKIDFSGIELAWNVNVENPNGFPIPFPKLDWNYDVNGVSLLKSSFAGAGEIAAGAAGAALISASVTYADILKAAGSLAGRGEVKSNLSLSAGSSIPGLESLKSLLDIPGTLPVLQR